MTYIKIKLLSTTSQKIACAAESTTLLHYPKVLELFQNSSNLSSESNTHDKYVIVREKKASYRPEYIVSYDALEDNDFKNVIMYAKIDQRTASHPIHLYNALLYNSNAADSCYTNTATHCYRHNATWVNNPMCEAIMPKENTKIEYVPRKKTSVEAIQYQGLINCKKVHEFASIKHEKYCTHEFDSKTDTIKIHTILLKKNDYLLKDNSGFSTLNKYTFEGLYK